MRPSTSCTAFAFTAVLVTLSGAASAATVRADRPRIWLSNGTGFGTPLDTFRQRCASDPAYSECNFALASPDNSTYPAAANAAAYLVDGNASHCTAALARLMDDSSDAPGSPDPHGFISNHGGRMADMAAAFDWCYAALSPADRTAAASRITAYADWYVATPATGGVYDDDENNVWASIALAGLALAGSDEDASAQRYLTAADTHWKNVIFPALAYNGDWWPEGMTYVQPAIRSLALYAAAWSTATDENIFDYGRTHGDLFEGYLRMHAYALRPDDHYVYFGDTSDNKQSIQLFSRPLVDMLTYGTASPLGQALSMYIHAHSERRYDYAGADGWMPAIFYDASREAATPALDTQPTARWLSRSAEDIVVLRSGWTANDTYVWITCGDHFSAHQHQESGSFQIFRHTMLSGSTGYYDSFDTPHWADYYSQHSVHANALAIVQPGEFFPTIASIGDRTRNVNDGGQRVLRMNESGTHFPTPDLDTYRMNLRSGPMFETGTLDTFAHGECFDYVACTVTAAYDSPGFTTNGNTAKVNEVTRQFVFVRPDTLVVFDRVEATDASYQKRFMLHGTTTPVVTGTNTFSITNGGGVLTGRTLLPTDATTEVVTNFTVDGASRAPSTAGMESGGSRLEVSPAHESARDVFLHVLRATDPSDTAPPNATATESPTDVTLNLTTAAGTYVVTFAKTGPLGGHLTFHATSGAGCDQDLGSGATNPDAGTSDAGGGPSDGGGSRDATPDGAPRGDAGTTGMSSGCACHVGVASRDARSTRHARLALLAVAALVAVAVTRRRRTEIRRR